MQLCQVLFFLFLLSLLFCTLLGRFLGGCNARYDIIERVVNYPDEFDLWQALNKDKFIVTFIFKHPAIKGQTVQNIEYNWVLNVLQPSFLTFSS